MRATIRSRLVGAAVFTAALLAGPSAYAFGPSVCTPGELPIYWNPTAGLGSRFALPPDINVGLNSIGNSTYYYARIRASRKVATVGFHFNSFDLDAGDSVSFPFLGNNVTLTNMHGVSFWTNDFASESGASVPWTAPIIITTDSSSTLPPLLASFDMDRIRVACLSEAPAPSEVEAWVEKKNVGILTQAGDTMYYSYPPPPTNNSTGAPYHLHVALNYEGPAVDFDLYARCGAKPDAYSFDYVGYSSSHQEFIDITTPCSSQWHFAVNSYYGAGVFDLTVGEGGDEDFCFAFTDEFTGPQKVAIADAATVGMKAFYGATLGGILPTRLVFVNGGKEAYCVPRPGVPSRPVDAYFTTSCTRSTSPTPASTGPIEFCTDFMGNAPLIVSHEFGHHYFGLPDEYVDYGSSGTTFDACGHSLMGSPNTITFCTDANHTRDPQPLAIYHDPSNSSLSVVPYGDSYTMWDKVAYNHYNRPINFTLSPSWPRMKPSNTPENYVYNNFSFNTFQMHIVTSYEF